jgi:hypothetical protein
LLSYFDSWVFQYESFSQSTLQDKSHPTQQWDKEDAESVEDDGK